jgi:hypothetical protein
LLYTTDIDPTPSAIQTSNFLCTTRDPLGGFYVVVENLNDTGSRLVHLTEDAAGPTGLSEVPTRPSFIAAEMSQNEAFAFRYCSIAAGADGTVCLQTRSQLWKVAP